MLEWIPLLLILSVCGVLLLGYPSALSLGGTALVFAGIGIAGGFFDSAFLHALPSRLFGIMTNITLIAVPLFIFMGVILEKSAIAEELLANLGNLFSRTRGSLGIAVVLVGALLAASTGIVGATVVTMGLTAYPILIKRGYTPRLAGATICATGTLGQIIPPSIALILLGDVLSGAYQQAQLQMGIYSPQTVSVGDLFVGALFPGLLLAGLYILYLLIVGPKPSPTPSTPPTLATSATPTTSPSSPTSATLTTDEHRVQWKFVLPPLALIGAVLGSIIFGIATPTEAAGIGALCATLLAYFKKKLSYAVWKEVMQSTMKVTSMIFLILIGATLFSLVFRGFGGDEVVQQFFHQLPGEIFGALLIVMVIIFLLGFILDFIEITFVVVPIVAPILLTMGIDPIWLGIMIAINLQTSFLTPPFGFALFYLRGVTQSTLTNEALYAGIIPFIAIQLGMLVILAIFPQIATWLAYTIKY